MDEGYFPRYQELNVFSWSGGDRVCWGEQVNFKVFLIQTPNRASLVSLPPCFLQISGALNWRPARLLQAWDSRIPPPVRKTWGKTSDQDFKAELRFTWRLFLLLQVPSRVKNAHDGKTLTRIQKRGDNCIVVQSIIIIIHFVTWAGFWRPSPLSALLQAADDHCSWKPVEGYSLMDPSLEFGSTRNRVEESLSQILIWPFPPVLCLHSAACPVVASAPFLSARLDDVALKARSGFLTGRCLLKLNLPL